MTVKVMIVGAPAIIEHEKLTTTGKVIGYDSIENEVTVELSDDLYIVTKSEFVHQEVK